MILARRRRRRWPSSAGEGRTLLDFLLDQEGSLKELEDAVIAPDLIASGSAGQGIDVDDMPGLAAVAKLARAHAEEVRRRWREAAAEAGGK